MEQALLHAVEQAGRARARSSEMYQHAVCADFLQLGADLLLDATAKDDLGCCVDGKIQHSGVILPFFIWNELTLLYLYPCKKSKN